LKAILSSLADFLVAAVRPRTPLAKSIVLVLVIKLIAIMGIGAFLLASGSRVAVDSIAMFRIIGTSASLADGSGR
jgi:hypothetical protein